MMKKGEIYTLRVVVEDESKSEEIMHAMANDSLINGCRVEAIARNADYFAERDDYKRYSEYLYERLERESLTPLDDPELEEEERVMPFPEFQKQQQAERDKRLKLIAERRARREKPTTA
jgi:hypothetical protein